MRERERETERKVRRFLELKRSQMPDDLQNYSVNQNIQQILIYTTILHSFWAPNTEHFAISYKCILIFKLDWKMLRLLFPYLWFIPPLSSPMLFISSFYFVFFCNSVLLYFLLFDVFGLVRYCWFEDIKLSPLLKLIRF